MGGDVRVKWQEVCERPMIFLRLHQLGAEGLFTRVFNQRLTGCILFSCMFIATYLTAGFNQSGWSGCHTAYAGEAVAYMVQGNDFVRRGDLEDAVECYSSAIELKPD